MSAQRGEIGYADLSPVAGSEQGGTRVVVIIGTNDQNSTVTVAPITGKHCDTETSAHIKIDGRKYGLSKDRTIMLEHMRTIEKTRLIRCASKLDETDAARLDNALSETLEIPNKINLRTMRLAAVALEGPKEEDWESNESKHYWFDGMYYY